MAFLLNIVHLCFSFLVYSEADYTVSILLVSFDDPDANLYDGTRCDFFGDCDIYLNLCLESQNWGTNNANNCGNGFKRTKTVNNAHSLTFNIGTYGQWTNPQTYTFTEAYERAYFKVQCMDDDYIRDDVIDKFVYWINGTNMPAGGVQSNITFIHPRPKGQPTKTVFSVNVTCSAGFNEPSCIPPPPKASCMEYLIAGQNVSGVYPIRFNDSNGLQHDFSVFCDMQTDGGGWTVIQNRADGTQSFDRTWADYKSGFGTLSGSFWLGNDKINALTNPAVTLRIEVQKCENFSPGFNSYQSFSISNEALGYALMVSNGTNGTAGDSFHYSTNPEFTQDGMKFSTFDKVQNPNPVVNCGQLFKGGWWFNVCGQSNLNGLFYGDCYYKPSSSDPGVPDGIYWASYMKTETYYSYLKSSMKIRPALF